MGAYDGADWRLGRNGTPAGLFDPGDPSVIEGDGLPLELPQAAPKPAGSKWKELAPLLVALTGALKTGGRVGGAALLQGFQQSQQRREQQERLSAQDAQVQQYRQAQLQAQAEARKATAENNELQRRQQFVTQFGAGLDNLETPDAVQAYLLLQGMQGEAIGIPRAQLEALVPPPTKLQERAAKKRLADLDKQFGAKLMEIGPRFTYQLPGESQPVAFEELLRRAGQAQDPTYVAPPPAPKDRSGFQSKDITLNGKRMTALFDPDSGNYYAVGKTDTPLAGTILDYEKPSSTDPAIAELRALNVQLAQQRLNEAKTSKPAAVVRRIDSKSKGFEQQQIVKNVQLQAEALQFADSLNINTTNPADDIGLIYAFAKAMDPNSVVREGEYATVQQYAQTWAQSFGFSAARIFSNTSFLTADARQNMKKVIRSKYMAGKGQYDALRKSYADQINKITGEQDGESYLTDYAAGFPADTVLRPPATNPFGSSTTPPATAPPPRANPFRR